MKITLKPGEDLEVSFEECKETVKVLFFETEEGKRMYFYAFQPDDKNREFTIYEKTVKYD